MALKSWSDLAFTGNKMRPKYDDLTSENLSPPALRRGWDKRLWAFSVHFSSVASVVFCSLWSHEPQHARPPCPSPTPGVYPDSCPLSWWCNLTISSSVVPWLQSFPASASFLMSQFFASGGQSIGVPASTSVLLMNIQDWSPLGWIGWISLQFKGHSSFLQHHSSKV